MVDIKPLGFRRYVIMQELIIRAFEKGEMPLKPGAQGEPSSFMKF